MFALSILLTAQSSTAETVLSPRVAQVAVFKPGLVYVVREATIPAGRRLYRLDRVPQALDGTLRYGSPDGATLSEIRTTIDLAAKGASREIKTISQLVAASVGRTVRLVIRTEKESLRLTGKVLAVEAPYSTITLQLPNGNLRSVGLNEIVEIDPKGLPSKVERRQPRVDLRFRAEATRQSRIRIVSLETGAAWVANYRLTMTGDSGRLESAGQLGLGPLALSNTVVRLVSGLPNLSATSRLDLASGSTSVANYLSGQPGQLSQRAIDPFELAERMLRSTAGQSYGGPGGFGGGGGMGGGGGLVTDYVDFIGYDPSDNSLVIRNDEAVPQFLREAITAARIEDLHTYDFGIVTLPAGGRITRTLSTAEVPLNTIYRWTVGGEAGFRRYLRLKNDTKAAWPAGRILMETDGIPLAQGDMPFTPTGQQANVLLGAAEDLLRTFEMREIDRQNTTMAPNYISTTVSNEAKMSATNTRNEPVDVELTYHFVGTATESAGATETRRPRADALNPDTQLTWQTRLKPGERREWTVRYRQRLN